MGKSSEANVREEVKKFVNAILSLMPSRNTISQLIMLLPLKEDELNAMFPEMVRDVEYWDLFRTALGIEVSSYTGSIDTSYSGIAYILRSFIDKMFEILREEKYRGPLSAILGEIVPNMEREWLEVRLKTVLEDKVVGDTAKHILLALCDVESLSISEFASKLNIEEARVKQAIYVLQALKLIEVSDDKVKLPYGIRDRYKSFIKRVVEGKL